MWGPAVTAVVLALGPGRALAADTTTCNVLTACPPTGIVSGAPATTGGQVTVTWNPTDSHNAAVDPTSPSMTITWAPAGQVPPTAPSLPMAPVTPVGNCSLQGTGPTLVCTYTWPSDLEVNGFVPNGTYTVTATARDCVLVGVQCSGSATATPQTIAVANPPAAPTGVTAAPGATPGTVTISWAPNPEPDIVGYQVFRGDGSFACEVAYQPPAPKKYSCTDAPPKDGSYTYKVVAHRWGATYTTNDVKAEPGTASAPTKALTVTGTSPASATTVPGANPGTLGPPGFKPNLVPVKPAGNAGGGGGFNPNLVAPGTTVEPSPGGDAGFQPTLPYGSRSTVPPTTDPAVITSPPVHKTGKTSVGSIAVVGAGLLIAVIALHGLWLRSEVRRAGALEPLDPEF